MSPSGNDSMPMLEIVVLHPADAGPATEGGADRLYVTSSVEPDLSDRGGLSVDASLVSAICRETDLPVRPLLRLASNATSTGAEFTRLVALGESYLAAGAEGVVFGFLDTDLLIDTDLCRSLSDALPGVPWTFRNVVDQSLEQDRVWRDLHELRNTGLDGVHTAGSPRGLEVGSEDLIARARRDRAAAGLMIASGGLVPEQVPWLALAGITRFRVGASARPGMSYKAFVDARHVRSWRKLLDEQPIRRG